MKRRIKWVLIAIAGLPVAVAAFGSAVCAARSADTAREYKHVAQVRGAIPGRIMTDSELPPEGIRTSASRTQQTGHTMEVAAGTRVELQNGRGDIRVIASDSNLLSVLATKRLGVVRTPEGWADVPLEVGTERKAGAVLQAVDIEVTAQDGAVRITSLLNETTPKHVAVDYHILVPVGCPVRVCAHEGTVETAGLRSDLNLRLERGQARIARMKGSLDAYVGSGDLHVDECAGPGRLETSRGEIHVVRSQPFGEHESLSCRTLDGRIDIAVPMDESFTLDIRRLGGILNCEFPLSLGSVFDTERIVADVGGGGPVIAIDTLDGPIHIGRAEASISLANR